ncbi:unnamed protein product [Gongylonema pulchrum]|uniref:Uncharacterized protein n=1 Tax=Gongylonema pulchrum TaxID=637853 RepID=A0A183DIS8_9BILA|nr:unnamed protein product [Gongylonema pulchrum]
MIKWHRRRAITNTKSIDEKEVATVHLTFYPKAMSNTYRGKLMLFFLRRLQIPSAWLKFFLCKN